MIIRTQVPQHLIGRILTILITLLKMEDNSANVAKMTRILAIAHLIVGVVLICFGIADRVVEFADFPYSSTGDVYFGIWTGTWMCITGGLGIPGSARERTGSRNAFAGVFMGFSITSAALGGLIILCYGISINESRERKQRSLEYLENYDASMAIRAIILILGIVEFVIGTWAAICCCQMTGCTCCANPQQGHGQWSYTSNPSDYVMTQGPDGVTVAVPIQSGGGVVTFQASRTQGNQPPLVLVPKGGEPMTAQPAPTGEMPVTGYPSEQVDLPPQYE